MKLKHISYILSVFLLIFFIYSCNDNDTYSYGSVDASADAQIYRFALKGTPRTKDDTLKYPAIAKTFFHIDQKTERIYNTDSLPYKINIGKLMATLAYSTDAAPSKTEIRYASLPDSIMELTEEDSIDFSRNDVLIKVTAQNGTTIKEYTVDLIIHQIDPDSVVWKQITSSNSPLGDANKKEKVVLKNNTFYRYFLTGGNLTLQTADVTSTTAITWSNQTITGLNNNIRLDDITVLNGNFYAVDNSGKAYSSSNGTNWDESVSIPYVHRIIGILPEAKAENDSLLVVTKEGSDYYLEKTNDLKILKRKTIINNTTVFDKDNFMTLLDNFDYSSITHYNRDNQNSNILSLIGPRSPNKSLRNSWLFISDKKGLSVIKSGNEISTFKKEVDFNGFTYDDKFFAMSKDSIYVSNDWGKRWSKAPVGYSLAEEMKTSEDQSVIVDDKDFIWIFGKTGTQYAVWRGRLNRLIK